MHGTRIKIALLSSYFTYGHKLISTRSTHMYCPIWATFCVSCTRCSSAFATPVTIRAEKAAFVLLSQNHTIRLQRHTECKERPVYHVTCFLPASACPETVPRADWDAAAPTSRQNLTSFPVPFVVIHHTYLPGFCNSTHTCNVAMRSMQRYHQNTHQWPDIGYQ
jgi:hypothetical protein